MKYTFDHVDRSERGDLPAVLIWHSDPINHKGTVEVVHCDEDWFWAGVNQRWMLHNERTNSPDGGYNPGFRSYHQTPTMIGNYDDCYIT